MTNRSHRCDVLRLSAVKYRYVCNEYIVIVTGHELCVCCRIWWASELCLNKNIIIPAVFYPTCVTICDSETITKHNYDN